MRKSPLFNGYALALFCCLISLASQSGAQQSPATTTQTPPATRRQTAPSRNPQPPARPSVAAPPSAPRRQPDTLRQDRNANKPPPPYYDYPFGSETLATRSLTVDEAVELALTNASIYQQTQLDERVAAEDVKQARVAFLPQFSAPLIYAGTTPSQVHNPGDPLIFSFVSASAINETTAYLNASGTLDLAGRLQSALKRSRAMLVAARAGTLIARRLLTLATIDAYYGLVLTRQKRRLADETLALAEGFVKVTEDQRKRGENEETDVFRARAAAQNQRDALEQARAGEAAAMNLLQVLTGVDVLTHIGVTRLTENVPTVSDFNSYTEEIIKTRPELAQLDAQKRAALMDARAARRELLPQLSYSLNGGFDAADINHLNKFSGGSAIVTLNVPIFNFGASRSRETQARLRAQSLELQHENTLRQLRQEFYIARAGAFSALERIKELSIGVGAAQRNITTIFARYRFKKATITDVIDAQSNYAITRLAYFQAIADYRTSRIRLEVDPAGMVSARNVPARAFDSILLPKCNLNLSQAPDLGGLRLGMTANQVQALFPSFLEQPINDLGVSSSVLKASDLNGQTAHGFYFEGVDNVVLEFTDGRLSLIRVAYPLTNKWESKDQFLAQIAPKFKINGSWKSFYDWENKTVRDAANLRDLGLECDDFRLSVGIGIEGIGSDQTPHFELEDMRAAQAVQTREEGKQKAKP